MKSTTKKPVTSSKKTEPIKAEGIPADVHERLLALLQANDVRQVDFAKAMKKSKDWASRTMSGERGLSVETLVKLADMYEVNLHWLLTGRGEMKTELPTGKPNVTTYIDDAIMKLKEARRIVADTGKGNQAR